MIKNTVKNIVITTKIQSHNVNTAEKYKLTKFMSNVHNMMLNYQIGFLIRLKSTKYDVLNCKKNDAELQKKVQNVNCEIL